MADRNQLEIDLRSLQNQPGAAYDDLADARVPKPSTNGNPLGLTPILQLEDALDDGSELLREILDRADDNPRGLGIALQQRHLDLLLVEVLAVLVAERIVLFLH